MNETPDLVRRLYDRITVTGLLIDADWVAFKKEHPMPPEQTEAVLLATIRHVLVLADELQQEVGRLSVALARRA